jgi:hypothetical protein
MCSIVQKKKSNEEQSANLTVSDLQDLGSHKVGCIYIAASGTPSDNVILLDCTATSHMFCDYCQFTNYVLSTRNKTVSVGDK